MSMEKSAIFLPVGKDFTIPARSFLAVGNARFPASDFRLSGRALAPAGAAGRM